MQLSLFQVKIVENKKRERNKTPAWNKPDKIKQEIKTWNTIKHIYRYQTLYKLYNRLFILTYNKKLACLEYYIDDEVEMYAEIKNTEKLPIKERILLHLNLIRKIQNNDASLIYENKKINSDTDSLFN